MPLNLTIVTAQRTVLEQDGVTKIVVPAAEGQITILPSHAALMSSLAIGEMVIHGTGVEHLAIHGGFIQVANDEVSVLADAAERTDDIDVERAEAALDVTGMVATAVESAVREDFRFPAARVRRNC